MNAQDTFSICAIDTITGEVGSAGASCVYVAGQGVMILSDVHPGVGVIHTQAWYLSANQAYARSLMNLGLPPQQIIDSLVANDAQNNPSKRQYGIVDFREGLVRSAAYTGINTDDYKNHITGPNYTIQGNILLGQEILDSMEIRFLNAEGELACRLMEALQGAKVPGADTRCMGDGTSSIGVFLRVAKPDDPDNDLYLQFNLPSVADGIDPIDSLQSLVDEWGGCEITGVSNRVTGPDCKVYPNPARNEVYFEFDADQLNTDYKLIIINANGLMVYHLSGIKPGIVKWDTKSYARGIYFYRLSGEGRTVSSGKIILE